MIISPRTGKPIITKQDLSAVERFTEFSEALAMNFPEHIVGVNSKLLLENLKCLEDAMEVEITSRKVKKT